SEAKVQLARSFHRHVECAVLIPGGPETPVPFLADTIASVQHYVGRTASHVVVIDDSRAGRFRGLEQAGVKVIDAPSYQEGKAAVSQRGSLFAKQAAGLRWLNEHLGFDVLLKMDTDALVIGSTPHRDAMDVWRNDARVGIVGAFTRRGDGSDKTQAL